MDAGSFLAATWLLLVATFAWVILIGTSGADMNGAGGLGSARNAANFIALWGVMMAAMMLPSALPMILLYRTVSIRLRAPQNRAIPTWLFAGTYLGVWLLVGAPVYAASVAVSALATRSAGFHAAIPYAIAAVLAGAGVYQLSALKHECLRNCKSPLEFVMERWRSGYAATVRLALTHALYCLGCCAALMIILVAAGAMSISWVLVITAIVFAEKVLPYGERTARAFGVALVVLGIAVAMRPDLARVIQHAPGSMAPGMTMH